MCRMRKEGIDCSTAFWNELEEFGLPVCASLNKSTFFDLQSKLGKINRDFVRDPNSHGCPKLCTITKYDAKVEEFDEMTTLLVQGQPGHGRQRGREHLDLFPGHRWH